MYIIFSFRLRLSAFVKKNIFVYAKICFAYLISNYNIYFQKNFHLNKYSFQLNLIMRFTYEVK